MNNLNALLAEVEQKKPDTLDKVSGATKEKADAYAKAVAAAVRIVKLGSINALDKGDMVNHDALRISKGALANYSNEKNLGILTDVYNYASSHTAELQQYGLTAEDITRLGASIDAFRENVQLPRKTIVDRKKANEDIPDLTKGLRGVFYKMDSLMALYENTDFYAKYKIARKIIDTGVRHRATPPTTGN